MTDKLAQAEAEFAEMFKALVEVARAAKAVIDEMTEYAPEWMDDPDWPEHAALAAAVARLQDDERVCAACDGDPEAHGLHICGKGAYE